MRIGFPTFTLIFVRDTVLRVYGLNFCVIRVIYINTLVFAEHVLNITLRFATLLLVISFCLPLAFTFWFCRSNSLRAGTSSACCWQRVLVPKKQAWAGRATVC